MHAPGIPYVVDRERSPYLLSRRKRLLDVFVACFGLLLTGLVFPFIWTAVKLTSRGPALFHQVRLGLDGRHFTVTKFRTMTVNAEADGTAVWAKANDPRVTKVGRFLRSTYLDELPQWWQVLKGDMSAVGPRPERPELAGEIEHEVPGFSRRLMAKPGITGWAQVSYKYGENFDDCRTKLQYDLDYIRRGSVRMDLQIMALTFFRLLRSKGQ